MIRTFNLSITSPALYPRAIPVCYRSVCALGRIVRCSSIVIGILLLYTIRIEGRRGRMFWQSFNIFLSTAAVVSFKVWRTVPGVGSSVFRRVRAIKREESKLMFYLPRKSSLMFPDDPVGQGSELNWTDTLYSSCYRRSCCCYCCFFLDWFPWLLISFLDLPCICSLYLRSF